MKKASKQLLAFILCLSMLLPLGIASFAAEERTVLGNENAGFKDVIAPAPAEKGETLTITVGDETKNVSVVVSVLEGASVSFSTEKASLRFVAKISKASFAELSAIGETTLCLAVFKTEDLDKGHGYTDAGILESAGITPVKSVLVNSDWFAETEGYYYAAASVDGIENYTEKYSAIAYVRCSNGGNNDVYAEYDKDKNSRSVYEVAYAAYEDRASEKGYEGYTNKADGVFSPYKKAELSGLSGYLDKIVLLDAGIEEFKTAGKFYQSPYTVSFKGDGETYDITVSGSGISSVHGVYLAGKPVEADKGADAIEFSVGNDLVWLAPEEEGEANEWYLVNTIVDKYDKAEKAAFPEVAPNGETEGYKWSFSASTITIFNSGFPAGKNVGYSNEIIDGSHYSYTARGDYYDLSDFKNLTLYVYVPEESVGATAYFQASSENPNSEGTDYYGIILEFTDPGWNKMVIPKSSIGANRSPLGWDKIGALSITMSGWNQVNKTTTTIYLSSITLDDLDSSTSNLSNIESIEDCAVFAEGGYAGVIGGRKYPANPSDDTAVVFSENGEYYIPVTSFAGATDEEAAYYSIGSIVTFTDGSYKYEFRPGKYYYVNGQAKALSKPAIADGRALFISTDDVKEIFGYSECHIDSTGLIVFSYEETSLTTEKDYDAVYDVFCECIFVRPSGKQIVSDLDAYSGGNHPYLLMNEDNFEDLRFWFKTDGVMQEYVRKLENSYGLSSKAFSANPNVFNLTDGQRLLSISRDVMEKLLAWSVLYKLYEKSDPETAAKYKERIWTEANAAANFVDPETKQKSWHPAHFLDVAELAYPMAIAYDWLYDVWTTEQKTVFEDAMFNLALKQTTVLGGSYSLGSATNNWNGVCNGGIMSAALALCNVERYKEDVLKVIDESIIDIEKGMWVYGPDGGYEEGPGYWAYGTTYVHVFISSLETACGKDYGLYATPGFAHSVYFTTYLGSVNSAWGFHDNGSGSGDTNIAQWFAVRSGDGNVSAIRRDAIANGWKSVCKYDVIYFNPHIVNNDVSLSLDAYYSLDTAMTFRSSWDKNNIFVGFHGGDNAASHGDLDIGNFVISVNGVFMIGELGSENYNVAGYFGNYRFSYYRKRAEGQNTMVMLPHGQSWNGKTGIPSITNDKNNTAGSTNLPTPDQNRNAVSECLRFESGESSAVAVVDMSVAYDNMTKGVRGMYFTDDRSTVIIQDEAEFDTEMDIWWFAHTQGNITISEDGRSATIVRSGITLYAEIVSEDQSAKFTKMSCVSLDGNYVGDSTSSEYYTSDTESSRSGFSKLCIKLENVKKLDMAVAFKVVPDAKTLPEYGTVYSLKKLDEWVAD